MSTLLRRQTRIVCFFCQTSVSPPPPEPHSFLCPHCGCWNRFDANGDILSDDPAMHDETLNRRSFARRASPRKDRLRTTFGTAPFCSTCQSNQRLVVSLLSSYLPPSDDDPDYEPRLAGFDAYKASMYARYPPVCERCAPLVEEEIRKKDGMARANALGSWLSASKRTDTRRQVALSHMDRHTLRRELRWWAARGALWALTLVGAVCADVAGAMGRLSLPERGFLAPLLPALVLVSILWTAWLPTYASFRRAELQGRKVRVRGRERYVALQAAVWVGRMLTASLFALSWHRPPLDYLSLRTRPVSTSSRVYFSLLLSVELSVAIYSVLVLRLHRTPAVRLIDTSTSRAASPGTTPTTGPSSRPASPTAHPHASAFAPAPAESSELLDSLSLSAAPIPLRRHTTTTTGPVFGHPSLKPATFVPPAVPRDPRGAGDDDDDDAMDWTPTASPVRWAAAGPAPPRPRAAAGAADATTGLETLLERANIEEPSGELARAGGRRPGLRGAEGARGRDTWPRGWVYALALVPLPLVGVALYHVLRE
ncbi:Ima1 N-terminal domain-containing protein [Gloeopeniophorella convolvens]|nr:Ima1 N-terminal domain-containing protein [Gloeopeniophorella convolvens]